MINGDFKDQEKMYCASCKRPTTSNLDSRKVRCDDCGYEKYIRTWRDTAREIKGYVIMGILGTAILYSTISFIIWMIKLIF